MKWLVALVFAAGCAAGPPTRSEQSPGIVFPTSLGEGHGDGVDSKALKAAAKDLSRDGGAPDAAAASPNPEPAKDSLPDPEPLRLAQQWEYELEWSNGAASVASVVPRTFPQPVVTARRMGRYAIELWIGKELVDRVRFDFPLLALEDPEPGRPSRSSPGLAAGAQVRTRVLVPAAPRARRAVLVDRATSVTTALPWPPSSG